MGPRGIGQIVGSIGQRQGGRVQVDPEGSGLCRWMGWMLWGFTMSTMSKQVPEGLHFQEGLREGILLD